jgi:hypothetical protein
MLYVVLIHARSSPNVGLKIVPRTLTGGVHRSLMIKCQNDQALDLYLQMVHFGVVEPGISLNALRS